MGATNAGGFDRGAAMTRSLLGYGVVAGVFYLTVGLVHALFRDGFDLSRHPLSLLTLGDLGWIQVTNLLLSGLMVVAAAFGLGRALRGRTAGRTITALVGLYGVCVLLSGVFVPDPMGGFPPGAAEATVPSTSGLLHLVFGLIAFLSLAVAAGASGVWARSVGKGRLSLYSWATAIVIVGGFAAGATLATETAGVLLLWLAVVAGWAWLAVFSVTVYRTVPHPDVHKRARTP